MAEKRFVMEPDRVGMRLNRRSSRWHAAGRGPFTTAAPDDECSVLSKSGFIQPLDGCGPEGVPP